VSARRRPTPRARHASRRTPNRTGRRAGQAGGRSRRAPQAPLAGRVAIVTGAGRGIGRACALALAAAGARVVLAARSEREIAAVQRRISAAGGAALAVGCDVRDAASVRALVATTVRRFGAIDILLNNAGAFQIASLAATDEELWDTILDTNLKGTYLVTRAALPHLLRRRGHVLNVVSTAGRVVFPGNAAYGASKWGLLGFTNVLREELRGRGVRVTALLPGAVDTPIWDRIAGRWNRARMLRPEVVARLVVEACSLPEDACLEELVVTPTRGG
jgi:NAD(P)-dependent dehydrogenase (short-subunit alcohol dehydrogenase family)